MRILCLRFEGRALILEIGWTVRQIFFGGRFDEVIPFFILLFERDSAAGPAFNYAQLLSWIISEGCSSLNLPLLLPGVDDYFLSHSKSSSSSSPSLLTAIPELDSAVV